MLGPSRIRPNGPIFSLHTELCHRHYWKKGFSCSKTKFFPPKPVWELICPNCGFQTFKQQNHYFLFIQTSTSSICRYIKYTHMHKNKHLLKRVSQNPVTPGGGCCHRHIPGYWGGTEAPALPVHWSGYQTPEWKLCRSPLSSLSWEWVKAENTALTFLSNSFQPPPSHKTPNFWSPFPSQLRGKRYPDKVGLS